MYRGTDWQAFLSSVLHDMKWGWMLFSFVFGILAQLVRAWRWRMLLAPIGERARRRSCEDAVFVSYAASLVVPRSGEVLRCGLLKRADGVSFSKALGTVFTERVVDSLLIVFLTVAAFFWQVPAFKRFLDETGMNLQSFLGRFTETGHDRVHRSRRCVGADARGALYEKRQEGAQESLGRREFAAQAEESAAVPLLEFNDLGLLFSPLLFGLFLLRLYRKHTAGSRLPDLLHQYVCRARPDA